MSTIKISVRIDRKAALLRGLVLGETAEIDVSTDTIPADIWPMLVGALDMSVTPPALTACLPGGHYVPTVAEPTAEAVTVAIRSRLAEVAEREAAQTAEASARLTAWEADPIKRCAREVFCGRTVDSQDIRYAWDKWDIAYLSDWGQLPADWSARKAAVLARIEPEIAAHNAPHLAEIERLTAEAKGFAEILAVREKEAKAKALAERKAERLATGYWERDTESYNERRHGAPWCAKVTFPSGAKPVYEWGESTGKWGKSGLLRLPCVPGEFIAWGQKDLRRPDRSDHTIQHMQPDGGMTTIDKTEAFRRWTAAQAKI